MAIDPLTVTLTPNETGQFIVAGGGLTSEPISVDDTVPQCALYSFQLSTSLYFVSTLTLTGVLSSITGPGVFHIQVVNDPDLYVGVPVGGVPATSIPRAFSMLFGTASSLELDRRTLAAGAVTFTLDLSLLTNFMSTSTYYTGGWNGTLLLWVCGASGSGGAFNNMVLNTVGVVDEPRRDTGRRAFPVGSHIERCPVTGLAISRSAMVMDGFRQVKVHPDAYDPPEEDIPEFNDPVDED